MILHSPIISGSLTFSDGATFTLPDNGVYSGSFSGSIAGIGDPETFSASVDTRIDQLTIDTGSQDSRLSSLEGFTSSIDTTIKTKLDADVVISGSEQVEFNDINNNPFQQGASSVTVSKSIVPSTSTLTLGTAANPFQDLYLSSASLYIDGTQVLSSNTSELILTTDLNQSLKILETGADTITLQSSNGDITLVATGNGTIELNAPIQIVAGNQIISSDGNPIQIGEDISVSGNITVTGNVDGVDIAAFKSSFDTFSAKSLVSGSTQVTLSDVSGFSSYSSSVDGRINTEKGRIDAILASATADADSFAEIVSLINSVDTTNDNAFASFYTSSVNKDNEHDSRLNQLSAETASIDSEQSVQDSRLDNLELATGSYQGTLSVSDTANVDMILSGDTLSANLKGGVVSGSSQITLSGVTGYDSLATTYEEKSSGTHTLVSGSSQIDITEVQGFASIALEYEEKSSATHTLVSGSSQVSYPGLSNIPAGIVSGSAQVKPLLPAGTVSGSSQVSYPSLANIPGGIVSSSAQVDYNSIANQPTIGNGTMTVTAGAGLTGGGSFTANQTSNSSVTLNVAGGIISGSSQVSYPSLSNIPVGIVSGSSQVTVQSTTGYSTISDHIGNTSNPHSVTKAQVGLGNVTNESKTTMFSSPAFTGVPTAPTAASNTNTTQIATTAYVQQELSELIGGAPAAFDTLLEISASIANGDSDVVALTAVVGGKLQKDQNLSDLTNSTTARANLGLGSLATLSSVGASQITDNSVGAAELNVSGNGTTSQFLRSDGDGSFTWATPTDTNTTYSAGTGLSLTGTTFANTGVTSNVAGTGISVSSATGASTISLDGTGTVGAGTYGSTSAANKIHTITVDAYGRISAIATGATGDIYGVTAGAGLTGGGTSGTVTVNVVGGNGITANADNIELNGTYTGTWAVTGGITATADVVAYASSDERLKDNIEIISNPIEKVQSLKGVTWNWNDNADELQKSTPNVGVIAQDVEKVLPQLVNTRDNGFKAVDYAKLTGLLIEAIKEQQKQIDELKSKLG